MKKIFYYILPLCLLWAGCSDFLEYKDKDKIIPKELKHYNELIYGELIKKTSGNEMMYMQMMTDEVVSFVKPLSSGDRTDSRREYFGYFTWAVNEQLDQDEQEHNDIAWSHFYHKILMCNIIENDLEAIEYDTEGVKKRLLGEVKFLRAMSYYYLVNLYGEPYKNKKQAETALGVPINEAISLEQKIYKRATLQKNYDLIEEDLKNAITLLNEGEQLNTIFRPNVHVARLLLSRIYLYEKEWEKALTTCNELLTESQARVETRENMSNYISKKKVLYNSDNNSLLFSWGERNNNVLSFNTTNAGHWEVNPELKNMYIPGDIRGSAFFSEYYYYPNKYFPSSNSARTCYSWSYRIEEAYLNRAEACIELGDATHLQQAMSDIYAIRQNRIDGDYELQTSSKEDIQKAFRDEKKMEFCFEDVRWFDIRRWEIEITHKVHNINIPEKYDTYVLKAGSPNYILSIPLEVQKVNYLIEKFEREETLVSK